MTIYEVARCAKCIVGAGLVDIFLHLLPENFKNVKGSDCFEINADDH